MEAREPDKHEFTDDSAQVERDLINLTNKALRAKYSREYNSHRNRKRAAKADGWTFDPAWADFRDFLRDMGPMQNADDTLDRIDSAILSYGPGLCRWASKETQTRNRKNTRFVQVDGETITLAEFADRLGVPYKTVHSALQRGEMPSQFAARVSMGPMAGEYCPNRYQNDSDGLADWRAKYEAWKRNVPSGYSRYRRPEIFDLVSVARLFEISKPWLEKRGFFELTPDEADRAEELLSTPVGRTFKDGAAWMDHALAQLARSDSKLARSLRPGQRGFRDLAELHALLTPPGST